MGTAEEERSTVTGLAPELMTQSIERIDAGQDVLGRGPGLGREPGWSAFAQRLFADAPQPLVVDADGLNALAGTVSVDRVRCAF